MAATFSFYQIFFTFLAFFHHTLNNTRFLEFGLVSIRENLQKHSWVNLFEDKEGVFLKVSVDFSHF